MSYFRQLLLDDETAATSVEYAVMLAGILLAAIIALMSMGSAVDTLFGGANTSMEAHGM